MKMKILIEHKTKSMNITISGGLLEHLGGDLELFADSCNVLLEILLRNLVVGNDLLLTLDFLHFECEFECEFEKIGNFEMKIKISNKITLNVIFLNIKQFSIPVSLFLNQFRIECNSL